MTENAKTIFVAMAERIRAFGDYVDADGKTIDDNVAVFWACTFEFALITSLGVFKQLVGKEEIHETFNKHPKASGDLLLLTLLARVAKEYKVSKIKPSVFLELVLIELEEISNSFTSTEDSHGENRADT